MGMFAMQLAKQCGAYVTAVTGASGLPFAKKWGADALIDYVRQPKLPVGTKYDLIFDLSAKLPYKQATAYMKPKSVYVNPVPTPAQIISTSILNLVYSQKNRVLLSKPGDRSIQALLTAVDKGLQIEVSRTFPFTDFAAAYHYAEKGGYIGKLTLEW